MIRYANQDDLKDIKEIWQRCFHDEEHYIDFFYAHHKVEKVTLVNIQNDRAVSMLNLIPGFIHLDGLFQEIRYVYAVATLPEFQGQGLAGEMIEYANCLLQKENIITVLVPANERLFKYYEKLGYHTFFYINNYKIPMKSHNQELELSSSMDSILKTASIESNSFEEDHIILENITAGEYKEIRDRHFLSDGYVCWTEEQINYAIKENELLSGKTNKVIIDEESHVIMYNIYNNVVNIRETTLDMKQITRILGYFDNIEQCESIQIKANKNYKKGKAHKLAESYLPYGMLYYREHKETPKTAYLNLALD